MKARFAVTTFLAATFVCLNVASVNAQTIGNLVGKNGQLKSTVGHEGHDGSRENGTDHHDLQEYQRAFAKALKISTVALSYKQRQGQSPLQIATSEKMQKSTLKSRAESAYAEELGAKVAEKSLSVSAEKTQVAHFKNIISQLMVRAGNEHESTDALENGDHHDGH